MYFQCNHRPNIPVHQTPKTDDSIGIISNNIKLVTGVTINQFSKLVSPPLCYTWFGGLLKGSICTTNWKSQSVFAIDFDDGEISIEDALERMKSRDLYPQLWYYSLSDSQELRKFRIVLFVDEPVQDLTHQKIIVDGLLALFPEADPSCKNACRFYFGGKESFVLNEQPIPTQKMLDILSIELITGDKGRNRKVPANLFGSMNESGQNRAFPLYYNRTSHFSPEHNTTPTSLKGGLEIINWKIARQRVKILDAFLNGEWLHHVQLFGLATNMNYIKGGKKLMKVTMEKYNKTGLTQYTQNNFNIFTYLNRVSYPPISIHTFSKYKEDEDLYDLISATKDQRGFIEQIEPIYKIPLDQAETRFKDAFGKILEDNTPNKIHLLILPTSIGKTESIISTTATIATPTNNLKDEIGSRMDRVEIIYKTTPDAVVFENDSLNKKIQYYYTIGLPKKATAVLYDVVSDKNKQNYSQSDIDKATNYINQLKESYHTNQTLLTTHSRAIHSEFKHDIIIFDEDPLKSLIEIKQLDITDLRKLEYQNNMMNNDLINVIQYLEESAKSEITSTPSFDIKLDELISMVSQSKIESNLFDFFASSYFVRDGYDPHIIHYVIKRELPKDKKIIIMSATIPLFIYQRLFGDRLNIIDIRDVEQKGQIIQYTKRSCSRYGLKRYAGDISQEVGNKPVITFKTFGNQFQNPVKGMYFGNCSGYDDMKGKDLVVVGTPHRNTVEYLLTAKTLGIDFKTTDTTMSIQKIEYNGFRFKMKCYDNKELRSIQLALIESDLIQAVGRARTLRTDATVEVYSGFPLRISDKFIF